MEKGVKDEVNREEAIKLFLQALEAKPEGLTPMSVNSGPKLAQEIIDGADVLMAYILEGRKP